MDCSLHCRAVNSLEIPVLQTWSCMLSNCGKFTFLYDPGTSSLLYWLRPFSSNILHNSVTSSHETNQNFGISIGFLQPESPLAASYFFARHARAVTWSHSFVMLLSTPKISLMSSSFQSVKVRGQDFDCLVGILFWIMIKIISKNDSHYQFCQASMNTVCFVCSTVSLWHLNQVIQSDS